MILGNKKKKKELTDEQLLDAELKAAEMKAQQEKAKKILDEQMALEEEERLRKKAEDDSKAAEAERKAAEDEKKAAEAASSLLVENMKQKILQSTQEKIKKDYMLKRNLKI